METSAFFIIAVFFIGVSVGGLFVTLQRQCTMDRIRQEFERELEGRIQEPRRPIEVKQALASKSEDVAERDDGVEAAAIDDQEFDWEQLPVPGSTGAGQPHVGM